MMLNDCIARHNETCRRPYLKTKLISDREFGVFLGIMFAARIEDKKGEHLWDTCNDVDAEGYRSKTDLSVHMEKRRFNDIRKWFSFVFADDSAKSSDPWWMVQKEVTEFNNKRRKVVQAANWHVLDESMSAWKPCTNKTGKRMMNK